MQSCLLKKPAEETGLILSCRRFRTLYYYPLALVRSDKNHRRATW